MVKRGNRVLTILAGSIAAGCASPALTTIPVRQLVEITDIGSLGVSPDGRTVVFRTERANVLHDSYELEWHALDMSTGQVQEIGSGGDPIYKDPGLIEDAEPVWLPGGRSFAFRALVDHAIGVWRAEVDGSGIGPLIVRDADVEELEAGPRGETLVYRLGPTRQQIERAERAEYDSGIRVDGSVDLAQNLFRGGSLNGRMATERFIGYWFIRSDLLWQTPRQKFRYNVATGAEVPLGPPFEVPAFEPPVITVAASAKGADGSAAEATWNGRSGGISARIAAGPMIRCDDPRCSARRVAWLVWRPGTHQLLIGFIDRNRRQTLATWDIQARKLSDVVSSDGLMSGNRWSNVPCAATHDALVCVSASAGSPPRLERIDLATGRRNIVYDPNRSMRSNYHPHVEQLSWRGKGGETFYGTVMWSGVGALRAPSFVNYYRCEGFLRGGEGDEWPIPSLLDAGFVVACINAAPTTGAEDAVATYRTGLEGIQALVALLGRRGLIDEHKVAVGGFSFGSEVASWLAIHSTTAEALSIASAQDEPAGYWIDILGAPDRANMIREAWHLGAPEKTPGRWKEISLASNVASIRAPLLMQLPEQEARRVPELAARLSASRTPFELYAYPDEDHVIVQPRHRLAIYDRNLDWFRYWLQDYSDPDPGKAGQYRKWNTMRARMHPSTAPRAQPQL